MLLDYKKICTIIFYKTLSIRDKKFCLSINKIIKNSKFTKKMYKKKIKLIPEIPYIQEVHDFSQLNKTDIILDIRNPEESIKNPLNLKSITVSNLPYFKIHKSFSDLDKNETYILYCDYGMMSRLQAIYLYEKGFKNIKILSITPKI